MVQLKHNSVFAVYVHSSKYSKLFNQSYNIYIREQIHLPSCEQIMTTFLSKIELLLLTAWFYFSVTRFHYYGYKLDKGYCSAFQTKKWTNQEGHGESTAQTTKLILAGELPN